MTFLKPSTLILHPTVLLECPINPRYNFDQPGCGWKGESTACDTYRQFRRDKNDTFLEGREELRYYCPKCGKLLKTMTDKVP